MKIMHLFAAWSSCKCCGILGKFPRFNLSMFLLSFCTLFLQLFLSQAQSQTPSNQVDLSSQDVVSSFQPSLAVVIGILAIMFSLTFVLLLYAKFCRNNAPRSLHGNQIFDGLPRSRSRFSGIDKTVIDSLPLFRFASLKGSREGLECAICLSKFEDVEVLRLLPKCKHAFHSNCLDQWLEKHSSCPLCRYKVSADDLSTFTYSNSLRFLWNQSEPTQESNIELYVQREPSHQGSSRFSVAGSFRKSEKEKKEDEFPIQQSDDADENGEVLHKFNHKIIVSDAVLMKNRWSNVSSSDLMFLNSEMLNQVSSHRFSGLEASDNDSKQCPPATRMIGDFEIMNLKEEMERKREFESKFCKIQQNESFPPLTNVQKAPDDEPKRDSKISSSEKRSMSEIVAHPRFSREFNTRRTHQDNRQGINLPESSEKEEKMRRLWLPIVRRTVQWFVNRERGSIQPQNVRESSNV